MDVVDNFVSITYLLLFNESSECEHTLWPQTVIDLARFYSTEYKLENICSNFVVKYSMLIKYVFTLVH
jgi:hypothetical protein